MESSHRIEARFYEKTAWDSVTCRLCPHLCSIAPSRQGTCGVRANRSGRLYLDAWGKITVRDFVTSDDLPLFHYKPDHQWLLLGSKGCTMRCPFCNTSRYSQTGAAIVQPMTPEEIVAEAVRTGCRGISFGVSEPAPLQEFIHAVFALARARGLDTHLATSGLWNPDALRELLPLTSAVTLGLKGLDQRFYQTTLGGDKAVVLGVLDLLLALKVHTEVSWLVIPGVTDSAALAQELLRFLERHAFKPPLLAIPYEPSFAWAKEGAPATREQVQAFLRHFADYPGATYNLHPANEDMNTRCRKCQKTLIRRGIARSVVTNFPSSKPKDQCPVCGTPVPFVP